MGGKIDCYHDCNASNLFPTSLSLVSEPTHNLASFYGYLTFKHLQERATLRSHGVEFR